MRPLTRILYAIQQGDPQAANELLPLVYDELRRLAAQKLAHEKPGQTLDATALVHEAYLRLIGPNDAPTFANSRHFFLAAAEAMRRILVDKARQKRCQEHGGGRQRLDLAVVNPCEDGEDDRILAVDEALQQLTECEPQVAEVVRLRWFAGLSIEKTAEALAISVRTANRHWAYARAWLYQQLKPTDDEK
jgi:RNA polymerase sigma factor (TIGR02999 family)